MSNPATRWLAFVLPLALAVGAIAGQPPVGTHLLFGFERGAEGWHPNVFGKGTMTVDRAPTAAVGKGAMAVHLRDIAGANLISPSIPFGQPWRQRRFDRVRFWAKAPKPMTKARITFATDESAHSTYSLHFPMLTTKWTQHTYPLTRCWNRGKKKLDAARITRIYMGGAGTMDFAIDHMELLEAAREVHLRPDRHVVVLPTTTPPTLDGKLDDPAWKAAAHLAPFVKYPTAKPVADPTEAWVTWDDTALYVAARLHSRAIDKLKASERARDAAVYLDDCLEVFVDPRHTHTEWYQFVTNSLGNQFDGLMPGGTKGRGVAWNGAWTVKAAVGKDSWVVEMRLPFTDFGTRPRPGDSWGFNVCREAPSTKELSYWTPTGGRFTRVRGLADLVFAKATDKGVAVSDVRLEEKSPGACILRGHTTAPKATKAAYVVTTQSPDGAKATARGTLDIAAGDGTVAIPVEFEAKEEGEAKLWLTLGDPARGTLVTYGAYNFAVAFPSQASLDKLVLVPTPKEMKQADGTFAITPDTTIWIGRGARENFIGETLQREIRETYGVQAHVRRNTPAPSKNVILVGTPETSFALKRALLDHGLLTRLRTTRAEGYFLIVEPHRVIVAGKDQQGAYYAARTFLQLLAATTSEGQPPTAPCGTIVDWPDFPFRGYMIYTSGWPQDPLDEAVLKEFIYKQVAGYKFNAIVWQVKAGYRYARWPRLANRCALPRETIQSVARFARNHGIEIIPNTNILGHANWIVLKHKELMEDGKPHQLCTRHPMTYPMLFDVLEEMLDVFDHPKRLHVGLDEVRWKTFNLPEAERCPRCRGIPKWKIYADHITRLRNFLHEKGVEMWMWGDMLLTRHNGGPPFNCHKALDHIPKDVVICNWSAEYAEGSSKELVDKGFRVVKANSRQVPASEQPYVIGNLASYWYRQPWCTMIQIGERGLMMENAFGADFSWNVNRENITLKRYIRERDINILRLVARPRVPAGSATYTPIDLAKAANRALIDPKAGDGKGWADLGPDHDLRTFPAAAIRVGPVAFTPVRAAAAAPRAIYLTAAQPKAAPLGLRAKVPSLAFLHTVVFPADADVRKKYFQRFLQPCVGVPIATVRITYAGGQTVDIPLRVGMEVGSWLPTRGGGYLSRCPYILRLATAHCRKTSPGATDAWVYVHEWPNPHPTWRIDRIEVTHTGTEAAYALLALSARQARQSR